MLQLFYKTSQFELNKIQGEIAPVDLRKVRYDKSHSEFALADMLKAATGITAVLPKQRIEMAVESFVWDITFLSVQDRPDLIIFGPLWYDI